MWDLVFNEKGKLTTPDCATFLGELADKGITDLFIFSHGWGTSETSARELYNAMFPLIQQAANGVDGMGKLGFAGIYWPSLWFPDTPATPAQQAGSTQAGNGAIEDASSGAAVLSGAQIARSLLPGFENAQQETVTKIGRLIDEGVAVVGTGESDTAKESRLQELNGLLQSLLPPEPDGEVEDQGETALLRTTDPKRDYQAVAEIFGSAPPGSATQGLGDWFATAINGAKDVVRIFSYTVMKARAGEIGRSGLGPLLDQLHQNSSGVRVHLIGHSFGARLVSFALAGIDSSDASPIASLLLVQGAFSHWSFAHAKDNPFGKSGALHEFADRVHGPLVATFSVYDWAVCRWYPKASFLSGQDTQAETAGRWGGMGSDGYQAVNPYVDLIMPEEGGLDYQLAAGTFHRVNAANVINDVTGGLFAGAHSDIRKLALAQLAVAAAAVHV
ncbi:hypothetical protein A5760_08885 [Mycobacterium colombiense]|uniref:Serine-threonine protein kinase n=1 Tax=Mycobacterium colombiense TaxID=339268 RepID=A0A1A0VPM3_9MYCO|nr:hypothetical protein A5760_08885 [Mycobacterium colombiense]